MASTFAHQAKRIARGLSRRLRDFGEVAPEGFDLDAVPSAQIALYFADGLPKLYQLTQWLPVFEAQRDLRTIVVVRQVEVFQALQQATGLRVLLVPTYEHLMALYDRADFHAVIYVNNGWTNFQSLAFQQAVHIHVNHGESDKICMVSNQAKAYDRVFVAGEAAVRRHRAALAWFDESHLVRVGRPQLDLDAAVPMPAFAGPTITYAPTWEGEDEANNYTSLDLYGLRIIEAALAQPGARVVYKPHPRVAESETAAVRRAHRQVIARMERAAREQPERGHRVLMDADMLGVVRGTDLLVADVSSVTLDHLYLRPDAPIILCDRRSDRTRLLADAPLASAVHVVDSSTLDALPVDIGRLLDEDDQREARHRMRDHYFDGLAPGESTERFWAAVRAQIDGHDRALGDLSRVRVTMTGDLA